MASADTVRVEPARKRGAAFGRLLARVMAVGAAAGVVAGMGFGTALAQAADLPLASAYPEDSFHTRNLQAFADDLRTATAGRVAFKIHPNGSLIKPAEIFAGVRTGDAAAGEVVMSSLAKEKQLFGMDALPFIVSGYGDAWKMWEMSRDAVRDTLASQGLELLYAVPWPPQNLYSRDAINVKEDFVGRRMRTYNPATEYIAEVVGAQPVSIQVPDLKRAIAEGALDMMITSSATGVEVESWSGMRHFYKVSAWIPKNIVFMNKRVFDALPDADRTAIREMAKLAETRGWQMSKDVETGYVAQLAAQGVEVSELDPFVYRNLDRAGEALSREWLKGADTVELSILLKYISERGVQ